MLNMNIHVIHKYVYDEYNFPLITNGRDSQHFTLSSPKRKPVPTVYLNDYKRRVTSSVFSKLTIPVVSNGINPLVVHVGRFAWLTGAGLSENVGSKPGLVPSSL